MPQQNTYNLGGKGENLLKLKKAGFKVPPFLVLPFGDENHIKLHVFLEKFDTEDFAVRSSANVEDGTNQSFAGQFKTLLHVPKNQIENAIEAVHASTEAKHLKNYNNSKEVKMAVVVQQMIAADVSGVLFTANPLTGNPTELVIAATYGLGEGLVSGALNADTFTLKNEIWQEELAAKATQKIAKNGKIIGVKVAEPLQNKACLNLQQLNHLRKLAAEIAMLYKTPQDIEFCIKQDEIWLLQSRPITALPPTNYSIYDNSNIIESYPGVTQPLTFSFILRMYKAVYEQLSAILGVPKNWVLQNEDVYANMLASLHGRVYYNLINWYRVLAMVPGFANNARFMEKMMGTGVKYELPEVDKYSKWQGRRRLTSSIFKMLRAYTSLKKETKKFQHYFDGVMHRYAAYNFEKLPAWQIKNHIIAFENVLLKEWKVPLVNDFFAMIFFGLFEKSIAKWYLGKHEAIHNDLLIGSQDIISAKPVKLFAEIDKAIRANPSAKALFAKPEKEVWELLVQQKFTEIKKLIDAYLAEFGDRSVGELKLETITFSQEPSLLIKRVQQNLKNKSTSANKPRKSPDQKRKEAEKELFANVKNPLKKATLRFLLSRTRYLVSNRENLRYQRTRAFGKIRFMFLHLGKALVKQGALERGHDVFLLKEEELFAWLDATSSNENLNELVALREKENTSFVKQKPLPARIESYGLVYTDLENLQPETIQEENLKGLACCAGIVEARVRVISDPNEAENLSGEILVTASTDPGWISLFYGAAGILVERGSLLSHSAIVSREMGLPCIVAIKGLLNILKTGDLVRMNGATGTIEILEKHG